MEMDCVMAHFWSFGAKLGEDLPKSYYPLQTLQHFILRKTRPHFQSCAGDLILLFGGYQLSNCLCLVEFMEGKVFYVAVFANTISNKLDTLECVIVHHFQGSLLKHQQPTKVGKFYICLRCLN